MASISRLCWVALVEQLPDGGVAGDPPTNDAAGPSPQCERYDPLQPGILREALSKGHHHSQQ